MISKAMQFVLATPATNLTRSTTGTTWYGGVGEFNCNVILYPPKAPPPPIDHQRLRNIGMKLQDILTSILLFLYRRHSCRLSTRPH